VGEGLGEPSCIPELQASSSQLRAYRSSGPSTMASLPKTANTLQSLAVQRPMPIAIGGAPSDLAISRPSLYLAQVGALTYWSPPPCR